MSGPMTLTQRIEWFEERIKSYGGKSAMAADGFLLSDCKNLLSEIEPRDQIERELIVAILTLHRTGFSGIKLATVPQDDCYFAGFWQHDQYVHGGGDGTGETPMAAVRNALAMHERMMSIVKEVKGDKL